MTEYESLIKNWLDKKRVDYDFQDGIRLEWGISAPFVLPDDDIVLRIDPQDSFRPVIENWGYRVVDIETQDLMLNLDLVMSKAIQGEEMSPIDSALHKSGIGASKGFSPHPSDPSARILPSHAQPVVDTDAPTLSSLTATLKGTLVSDGGRYCSCRFQYGTATMTSENVSLSILFPWRFYKMINIHSPNISLNFGETSVIDSFSGTTAWQNFKITGDEFNSDLMVSVGQRYGYKAEAKNDSYSDEGQTVFFTGV